MDWLDAIKWDDAGLVPAIAQEAGSGDVLMVAWMNREALAQTVARGQAVYWSRSRQRLWHKGEESGHFQQVHELRLDCDGDVLLLKVTQLGHQPGIACHTGRHACFFNVLRDGRWQPVDPVLQDPQAIYRQTAASPDLAGERPGGQAAAGNPCDITPDSLSPVRPDGDPRPATQDMLDRLAAVLESRKPAAGGDPGASYVARLFAKGTDAVLKKVGEEAVEVVMAAKDGDRQKLVYETADLWFHSMVALAHFNLTPRDVLAELMRREGQSGLEEFALRKLQQREQSGA